MILIFFDLETTGLNFDFDDVIEIGAIKASNNEIIEKFHTFVNPRRNIPDFVTNLTGISKSDVENAPDIDTIKEKLNDFIGNYPLLAHNANFDRIFLEKLLGRQLENQVFDTLELARLFFPEFPSHSLQNLIKQLSLKKGNAHRALNDTIMLYSLFQKIIEAKNIFPEELLTKIKEIWDDKNDLSLLFGEEWKKPEKKLEGITFKENINKGEINKLPFKSKPKEPGIFIGGVFFADAEVNETFLKEIEKILNSKKLLLLPYSENIKKKISEFFLQRGYDIQRISNFDRIPCLKKVEFFLDNPELIPSELKNSFAILISYLFKTQDFLMENAPPHILKNPAVRALSTCNENFEACEFVDKCPFYKKIKTLEETGVIIGDQRSIQYLERELKNIRENRALIIFEAFRMPRVISFFKTTISEGELNLLLNFQGGRPEDLQRINTFFNDIEPLPHGTEITEKIVEIKPILAKTKESRLDQFLSYEKFLKEGRSGTTFVTAVDTKSPQVFQKLTTQFNPLILSSRFTKIQHVNVLSEILRIGGKHLDFTQMLPSKTILSVAPLFLHSPVHEEFPQEFVKLFKRVHKKCRTIIVCQQQTLLREINLILKKEGFSTKAFGTDLMEDEGEIDILQYEVSPGKKYEEIYLLKLPFFQMESLDEKSIDNYSALFAKNFVDEISNDPPSKSIVFYIDSKLRNSDYRMKCEEMFLSFPLFLEKEESLVRIVENWRNKN